jgi:hypothetical protein
MGRTREQKAAYEARMERLRLKHQEEKRARPKRSYEPRLTSAHFEAMLVNLAYLSKIDGTPALEQFERCERALSTMRRVEALMDKLEIKSKADWGAQLAKAQRVLDEKVGNPTASS